MVDIDKKNSQDALRNAILADNHLAPRGFEPLTKNTELLTAKEVTENKDSVFAVSLDILLQKYPELEQLITAWQNLPEHIKAAIKALIQTNTEKK